MSAEFRDQSALAQRLDRLSAVTKPVVLPKRKIRCVVADFYVEGKPAVQGQTYTLDADLARAMVKFGRAEYA
jgi:hypothetical protein